MYKRNIDFLMKQLRDVCYAKVRGNGADISVREVFRHFDSDKEVGEDDAGEHGIDKKEFVQAMSFVKVIMVQGLTKQRRLLGDKPMYKWLPEPVCTRARPYSLLPWSVCWTG